MAGTRCLITGGAGFIGSHLVDEALRRGWEVTVLDDLSSGRLENLEANLKKITFLEGSVTDRELVKRSAEGQDLVFHLAAIASVPRTIADPYMSAQINDLGTLNVLLAARDAQVKRVILASSAAVYGSSAQPPVHEALTPRPESPYAAHKIISEHYGSMFRRLYGLEVVALRFFNVYGPRQDPTSPYSGVISLFIDRLGRGQAPVIFGDGGQSRDFIFVSDVVNAAFLAAQAQGVAGRAFNVATGRPVTILETANILAELFETSIAPIMAPARPGDIYASWADTTIAKNDLGFIAQIPFADGLKKTWAWSREE